MYYDSLQKLMQIDSELESDDQNVQQRIENKVKELLSHKYQLIDQNSSLNENNLELENKI